MKNYLLCCDWGTSSFRLKLVDEHSTVHSEIESNDGISKTFDLWKNSDYKQVINRYDFFIDIVKKNLQVLEESSPIPFTDLPIIISGMASSSIGIKEVSYATLPFAFNGSQSSVYTFNKTENFPHEVFLVSGVKSDDDVMRGEETQLIGLFNLDDVLLQKYKQAIFIFPGTHSKHVYVKENAIINFQTFMTGEFFQLFAEYSILKSSVSSSGSLMHLNNTDAFKKGVQASSSSAILHALFRVRTNQLFEKLTTVENYFYLSGLLIGAELRSLSIKDIDHLIFCSGKNLFEQYKIAAEEIGFKNELTFLSSSMVDKATIAGQVQIFKQFMAAKISHG